MAWRGRAAARQAGRGGEGMSMEMMGICSVVPDTALLMFELANLACIFQLHGARARQKTAPLSVRAGCIAPARPIRDSQQ